MRRARLSTGLDGTRRLLGRAARDDVAGLAAELACRSFLELFPFFILLASVGGALEATLQVQNPAHQLLDMLEESLPQGAADPIRQQLETVLGTRREGLAGLSVLGALWIAAGSGATLLKATNRILGIRETRPWWERQLVGLWLAFLAGSVLVVAFGMLVTGQLLARAAEGSAGLAWIWALAGLARWPLLVAVLLFEAAIVYRVAPNVRPRWRWVTPGAALFAAGWLAASTLFIAYVGWSGSYASTYGVVGGVIVLLLWLQLTGHALLLGAELNALIEQAGGDGARPGEAPAPDGHPTAAAVQQAAAARLPLHRSPGPPS